MAAAAEAVVTAVVVEASLLVADAEASATVAAVEVAAAAASAIAEDEAVAVALPAAADAVPHEEVREVDVVVPVVERTFKIPLAPRILTNTATARSL